MRNRFGDHVGQQLCVERRGAGNKRRTGCFRQLRYVKGALDRAVRRRRRFGVRRRQRRVLTARHAVNVVVEQYDRQVDIAACRMDEVVAADSRRVAVAGAHDDFQARLGELHAGCYRQCAAVRRVDGVEVQVAG